ncbi:luc7-like protein 3 [Anopheles darlingi]|uniref:Luc7-like protein 3 n=1 Tax=Anopheles darlingi TaxID=43151 RepID=W5JFN8_ANODA|nr:luc7-like protein 3 [Anopheles darlingi]ETN63187.1 luc7-like protein 3 [Anopheles darlingi]
MVDVARQLLDELMGRNRNLDPTASAKEVSWADEEFCPYFLVKFCPHDLFVNTRADLGQCTKLHDDEAKRLYDEAKPCRKKTQYEEDFLRFCTNMINEVDRKIAKGKQRLLLMNSKTDGARSVPKQQEHLNALTEKINKLVREAEEAGTRGDVEQAQGLMEQCDKLKEEKDALVKQHESNGWSVTAEIAASQEKQMEVCEVCGAFLIVGDAQQRIDDHLTGKQHLGYSKLRKAVDEMYEARRKNTINLEERRSRDDDRRRRDNTKREERKSRERDDRHNSKREDRDRNRYRRDYREHKDRNDRHDNNRQRDRNHRRDRNERNERERIRDRDRSRSRSY